MPAERPPRGRRALLRVPRGRRWDLWVTRAWARVRGGLPAFATAVTFPRCNSCVFGRQPLQLRKYPFRLNLPPPAVATTGRRCRGGYRRAGLQAGLSFTCARARIGIRLRRRVPLPLAHLLTAVFLSARAPGIYFAPWVVVLYCDAQDAPALAAGRPLGCVSRSCTPLCPSCCVWGRVSRSGTPEMLRRWLWSQPPRWRALRGVPGRQRLEWCS